MRAARDEQVAGIGGGLLLGALFLHWYGFSIALPQGHLLPSWRC
jgi:hypothetical protein